MTAERTEPAELLIGAQEGPCPPLAAQLAAWFAHNGGPMRVLDPRGEAARPRGRGPLYVHVQGNRADAPPKLPDGTTVPDGAGLTLFGPGAPALASAYPRARVTPADPEPAPRCEDLAELPICTYAGFGRVGPAFRVLAGRGDRVRPVGHVLREVVYLVEMHQAGHLIFDDEDLAVFPGWLHAWRSQLRHLPWLVTWQGTAGGEPVRG